MPQIRLVIFDLCDTLYKVIKDPSVHLPDPTHPETTRLVNPNSVIEAEGIRNELFPGVRELFEGIFKRNILISFASFNYPHAWKWFFDEALYNLNFGGNLIHFPKTASGKHENGQDIEDAKGYWVKDIISKFNREIFVENPISENQVVFIDDLIRNHAIVNKICPDVFCALPTPYFDGGMAIMLEMLDELLEND